MTVIPINDAVAADLARRGVYPLERYEQRVPDEWLSLLEQLHGGIDPTQHCNSALNGAPLKQG